MKRVAVYGSLRKGLRNHTLLEQATYIGDSEVQGFKMYSMGGFPFCTEVQATASDIVQVEVYEVDQLQFRSLDRLEGYPSFYNRKLVVTSYGLAWMYYINDNDVERYPFVESGDWKAFYNER